VNVTNITLQGTSDSLLCQVSSVGTSQKPGDLTSSPQAESSRFDSTVRSEHGTDRDSVDKALEELNKKLESSGTRVELAPDRPPNHLWLNIVDQATGQVIQEFPPEGLRHFMETGSVKGITFDKRS
jgi:uncharacterized FlaG/YvyC family protein